MLRCCTKIADNEYFSLTKSENVSSISLLYAFMMASLILVIFVESIAIAFFENPNYSKVKTSVATMFDLVIAPSNIAFPKIS